MKIGTSGWSYLPKKFVSPGESRLTAYAKIFPVAEVNSTFYALPKTSTARAWRKEVDSVNKEFEFTVKVPKLITHISYFSDFKTWEKIKAIGEALRAKILIFQTPPTFKDTEENINRVKNFFSSINADFKFAIECRGWKKETIEKIFPEIGLIQIVDPFTEKPIEQEINYYKLQGMGAIAHRYRFKDNDLQKLKEMVKEGDYVIFNNVFMYDDAMKFMELMGNDLP